ncbi:hypothetical protein DdX_04672 [Ditylenchus destructor]|uniref:Uncharacterized protein n=1 Tax=Ditylenchus destructor TaxID=166010 RepID=A0AAD4NBH6_9BILA|nr:hypothetical protein DdX_04672 [Ditylenchus destructor]
MDIKIRGRGKQAAEVDIGELRAHKDLNKILLAHHFFVNAGRYGDENGMEDANREYGKKPRVLSRTIYTRMISGKTKAIGRILTQEFGK